MSKNSRQYKRKLFKAGSWIKILQLADVSYPLLYKIIDISQGGIGLISTHPREFIPGSEFFIIDIDGKPVGKKIKFQIKYVQPFDGPDSKYRVGCEFVEIEEKSKI